MELRGIFNFLIILTANANPLRLLFYFHSYVNQNLIKLNIKKKVLNIQALTHIQKNM